MSNRMVRITNITIKNFKNVKNGMIDFTNKRKDYKASILGLYGQNGSGKTALIDAVQLLKHCLCGQQILDEYVDYINVDADSATLSFQFRMKIDENMYDVWYEFSLKRTEDDMTLNLQEKDAMIVKYKVEIFGEILSYACLNTTDQVRKNVLIDTRTKEVFHPKTKYVEFVGKDKSTMMDLMVVKKYAQVTSRSFVFSSEMINIFRKNCTNKVYLLLIEQLLIYGNRELFIIKTRNSGLISMNTLPLAFNYKGNNMVTYGNVMMPLDTAVPIPNDAYHIIKK